jgi:uncharacterized membrane protein YgcG
MYPGMQMGMPPPGMPGMAPMAPGGMPGMAHMAPGGMPGMAPPGMAPMFVQNSMDGGPKLEQGTNYLEKAEKGVAAGAACLTCADVCERIGQCVDCICECLCSGGGGGGSSHGSDAGGGDGGGGGDGDGGGGGSD